MIGPRISVALADGGSIVRRPYGVVEGWEQPPTVAVGRWRQEAWTRYNRRPLHVVRVSVPAPDGYGHVWSPWDGKGGL